MTARVIAIREGADPTRFLRIGKFPPGGKSTNGATGKKEAGVSVFETSFDSGKRAWHLIANHPNDSTMNALLEDVAKGARPILLVSGTVLPKRGSDGEPLLKDPKVVQTLGPREVLIDGDTIANLYTHPGTEPARWREMKAKYPFAHDKIADDLQAKLWPQIKAAQDARDAKYRAEWQPDDLYMPDGETYNPANPYGAEALKREAEARKAAKIDKRR